MSPSASVTTFTPAKVRRLKIVTCMWGVSAPPRARRRAKEGAAKRGSLMPTVDRLGCNNGVDCDTGGTERRRERPNSQTNKNVDGPRFRHRSNDARPSSVTASQSGGTVIASFGSPHLFLFGRGTRGGIEGAAKAS
jgi:hypothetical protein